MPEHDTDQNDGTQVDEVPVEDLPEVVYHYTDMATLLKIVESKQLWAFNVKYLNDYSEYSFFIAKVAEAIHEFADIHPDIDKQYLEERKRQLAHEDARFFNLPFVVSFAATGDSLTHWRSYCPRGNGVAIGFRTRALLAARTVYPETPQAGMIIPQPAFGKVRYVNSDRASIMRLLEQTYIHAKKWRAKLSWDETNGESIGNVFRWEVDSTAAFYKHSSFEDEREYRLGVGNIDFRRDLLRYFATASTLRPYVPLDIPRVEMPEDVSDRLWTSIASVRIGPTPNKELSVDAVLSMLESYGATCFTVDATNVPYRDW